MVLTNNQLLIQRRWNSGAVSRADAMQTAMRSPRMMQAMIAAASNPDVNFKLAL